MFLSKNVLLKNNKSTGKAERTVYIGDAVAWDKSSAEHKNGILTITVKTEGKEIKWDSK